ncbi:MAG: BA14K family protein [Hyphomicrobiales bacterium]|nr:MAG: BA14K family protein [Hyphomicrobiales bacterium]
MNKIISRLCTAAALVVAFGAMPATAASVQYGNAQLQNAQFSFGFSTGGDRRDRFERRGNSYYYNGYRGYRDRRDGFRFYNGYWFPNSAFSFSFRIDGNRNRGGMRLSSRHVEWCQDRYRSYRLSDNSYQPYNGPRRDCVSPYSRRGASSGY